MPTLKRNDGSASILFRSIEQDVIIKLRGHPDACIKNTTISYRNYRTDISNGVWFARMIWGRNGMCSFLCLPMDNHSKDDFHVSSTSFHFIWQTTHRNEHSKGINIPFSKPNTTCECNQILTLSPPNKPLYLQFQVSKKKQLAKSTTLRGL